MYKQTTRAPIKAIVAAKKITYKLTKILALPLNLTI